MVPLCYWPICPALLAFWVLGLQGGESGQNAEVAYLVALRPARPVCDEMRPTCMASSHVLHRALGGL